MPGKVPEGSALLGTYIGGVIGIPGPELALANGEYFYSGAEAHNATRKAALITRSRGQGILAMAVFTQNIRGGANTLSVLFPANGSPDPAMEQQFKNWARQEIARQRATYHESAFVHLSDQLVVDTRTLGQQ